MASCSWSVRIYNNEQVKAERVDICNTTVSPHVGAASIVHNETISLGSLSQSRADDFSTTNVDVEGDNSFSAERERPSQVFTWVCHTRFEVLWRPLINNYWEIRYPAPLEAGKAFVDTLIHRFTVSLCQRLLVSDTEAPQAGLTSGGLLEEQAQRVAMLQEFAEDELSCIQEYNNTLAAHPGVDFEMRPPIRFLPQMDMDKLQELLFGDQADEMLATWAIRTKQACPGRALCSTRRGLCGMVPESTRKGDRLWILAGGDVPFVLRPLGNGNSKLVGAAYLHGAMHEGASE
jgi:hypothetical protein